MARYAYDRLTFLDNSFLILEKEHTPMHIAGTATFDAAPLTRADGSIDIDRIRAYVESRLHLIPRYRQWLQQSWFQSAPIWVDYEHFNIHYHVRHAALPKPGDARQLKRLAARIMAQHLDRSKPLWEIWIVEGLDGGESIAMISKIHHCMVDGVSSVDLLNVLLTPFPIDAFEPAPSYVPRPVPTEFDLLWETAGTVARLPFEIGKNVSDVLTQMRDPRSDVRARVRALRDMFDSGFSVSDTPLNQTVGPHRRFDWLAMSLEQIKDVKNRLGGTVNDVVLATVAGAVRRHLRAHRVALAGLDFRVMCPVSVRPSHAKDAGGNRVIMLVAPLPVGERSPRRRLDRVIATTRELKASRVPQGSELIEEIADWTTTSVVTETIRLATRLRVFNLIVTNVPGPPVPLYLLGAPVLATYPLVPLYENQAFGIALLSYAGQLFWGLTSDWDRVPDLHDLALGIAEAFDELR